MLANRGTLGLILAAACAQLILSGVAAGTSNCYDHQTETYDSRFKPTYCTKTCTVTPFFSPDTSITTYVNLIEAATESIDIYTPGAAGYGNAACRHRYDRCSTRCGESMHARAVREISAVKCIEIAAA